MFILFQFKIMKIIQIFFLLVLFNIVIGDGNDCTRVSDPSVDKCKAVNVEGYHCCYYETPKSETKKGCAPISEYQYKHIDVLVKYYQTFGVDEKQETEDKDAKMDCNSQSLKFSLIFLILLFI